MQQVRTDFTKAVLTPLDAALCAFAAKLTRTPSAMRVADIEQLRGLGLSDRGISDAVQVIAYFNYINRIADGLGIEMEPDGPSPGSGA